MSVRRQIPNLLTAARLLLAVAAFACMGAVRGGADAAGSGGAAGANGAESWAAAAFVLFLVASVTDFLDGMLARRYGWVSAFGRVADPVVDKVLTIGTMTYVAATPFYGRPDDAMAVLPVWAVVLTVAREFLITALRGLIESRGMAFPADRLGKYKMVAQVAYLSIALAAAGDVFRALGMPWLETLRDPLPFGILFWIMMGLLVVSGLQYCVRGAAMLRGAPTEREGGGTRA